MTYRRATHAYELVAARSVGGKGTLHEIIKEGKVDGRVPKNVENILPPKKKKLKEGQYVNYIDKRARGKTILTTKIYGVRKKKGDIIDQSIWSGYLAIRVSYPQYIHCT